MPERWALGAWGWASPEASWRVFRKSLGEADKGGSRPGCPISLRGALLTLLLLWASLGLCRRIVLPQSSAVP